MSKPVRRFISYWRKGEDKLSGDLELAAIDLEGLRRHFGLEADDPMYEVYILNEPALGFVRVKVKHDFEFDKFDYTLECSSIGENKANPLLEAALPGFYAELEKALAVQMLPELAEQLPGLKITGRCACDEKGCATMNVESTRVLNVVEQNIVGSRYDHSIEIEGVPGMVVMDVDNFGRLTQIEILDRPELAAQLKRLGVPPKSRA